MTSPRRVPPSSAVIARRNSRYDQRGRGESVDIRIAIAVLPWGIIVLQLLAIAWLLDRR